MRTLLYIYKQDYIYSLPHAWLLTQLLVASMRPIYRRFLQYKRWVIRTNELQHIRLVNLCVYSWPALGKHPPFEFTCHVFPAWISKCSHLYRQWCRNNVVITSAQRQYPLTSPNTGKLFVEDNSLAVSAGGLIGRHAWHMRLCLQSELNSISTW